MLYSEVGVCAGVDLKATFYDDVTEWSCLQTIYVREESNNYTRIIINMCHISD